MFFDKLPNQNKSKYGEIVLVTESISLLYDLIERHIKSYFETYNFSIFRDVVSSLNSCKEVLRKIDDMLKEGINKNNVDDILKNSLYLADYSYKYFYDYFTLENVAKQNYKSFGSIIKILDLANATVSKISKINPEIIRKRSSFNPTMELGYITKKKDVKEVMEEFLNIKPSYY